MQIVLGTEVREAIDVIADAVQNRAEWVSQLGLTFYIHRSYSLLLLGLHVYLFYKLWKTNDNEVFTKPMLFLVSIVVIEILSGVIMAYFAIPAFIQPIHLLFGSLIVGVQYYLFLIMRQKGNEAIGGI